mmetsp:Transcript_15927/g.40827  ORF Transcript_15927/g.40827 Transcript_15927/m.40827 type:complete len:94 (-) Transcript_15927:1302-1583(-)
MPSAYVPVMKYISEKLNGTSVLRMATAKAGPVITDNGNFLLDVDLGVLQPDDVASLDTKLHLIPGVIETGFFVDMAVRAYFGQADGSVVQRDR